MEARSIHFCQELGRGMLLTNAVWRGALLQLIDAFMKACPNGVAWVDQATMAVKFGSCLTEGAVDVLCVCCDCNPRGPIVRQWILADCTVVHSWTSYHPSVGISFVAVSIAVVEHMHLGINAIRKPLKAVIELPLQLLLLFLLSIIPLDTEQVLLTSLPPFEPLCPSSA